VSARGHGGDRHPAQSASLQRAAGAQATKGHRQFGTDRPCGALVVPVASTSQSPSPPALLLGVRFRCSLPSARTAPVCTGFRTAFEPAERCNLMRAASLPSEALHGHYARSKFAATIG
jgi:hypothetical protein